MTLTINNNTNNEEIEKLLNSISQESQFESEKYLGKIKLEKDPVELQKAMRDEWN